MIYLHLRDKIISIGWNNLLQVKTDLSWLPGIQGVSEITSQHGALESSPITALEVKKGLLRFANSTRNRSSLFFCRSGDMNGVNQLVSLKTFCSDSITVLIPANRARVYCFASPDSMFGM